MTNRILIPWTGGFDSTALVISAFSNGIPFDTCFFRLGNNEIAQKQELKARKNILKKLRKMYKKDSHIMDIIVNSSSITKAEDNRFPLPLIWITTLLHTIDLGFYKEIQFGYVKFDDFWHVRSEFEEVYKSGYFMTRHNKEYPRIEYPFEWQNKQAIKDVYYGDFKNILKAVWYCEEPDNNKACGTCPSCKRHNEDLR